MALAKRIDVQVPTEAQFKPIVRNILEKMKFAVSDIPADPSGKRADFMIRAGEESILVELKIKGDDESESTKRNTTHEAGKIYTYSESSLRRNVISGLVDDAVSQMIATPLPCDFRLVWMHAAGHYAEHMVSRIFATLYGSRYIMHTEKKLNERLCFYFDNSSFYNQRNHLAGVIVSQGGRFQLYINDRYIDHAKFSNSIFRGAFDNAYCDPAELEAKNEAYLVDSPIDRNNTAATHDYIRNKYGCGKTLDLDLKLHTAEIKIGSSRA